MTTEIRADIAANVGSVAVAVGDAVVAGATLVVLESMKMEIPILAPLAGTVAVIAVTAGDIVQEGDLIAALE